MNPILHPIFALLASVTRQELARQVAYLKEENKILRARLPERPVATPQEKRQLLTFGRKLGVQLRHLISIGSYNLSCAGSEKRKRLTPRNKLHGNPVAPECRMKSVSWC